LNVVPALHFSVSLLGRDSPGLVNARPQDIEKHSQPCPPLIGSKIYKTYGPFDTSFCFSVAMIDIITNIYIVYRGIIRNPSEKEKRKLCQRRYNK
jgi:hypothetical protein